MRVPAVCAALSALLLASRAGGRELHLVNQGRSDFHIVVARQPTPPEAFAAEEFQRYIETITGIRLPADAGARGPAVFIGGSQEAPRSLLEGRRPDSFAILEAGGNLYLAGNTPAGTLCAVYRFLEKYGGCGWLRPGDEVVPRKASIVIPPRLQDIEEPSFAYRNLNLYPFIPARSLRNADWAAKNGLNWLHACTNGSKAWEEFNSRATLLPEMKKRALRLNYGGHTFKTWVSPREYFEDHPEYFSLIGGKRDPAQLCVSNPEVVRVAAANMTKFLDQNPEVEMLDIWLNDVTKWCECDACRRMEGAERPSIFGSRGKRVFMSRTNSNIKFVNAIAREVAKRHPNVLVQTLAYFMLIDAPEIRPEPNVMVGFTPIERCPPQSSDAFKQEPAGYWRPLYAPGHELNRSHLAELEKWLNLMGPEKLFTYEYYSQWNTARHMVNTDTTPRNLEEKLVDPSRKMFRVFTDTMAKDIAYYAQIGMKNISTEVWDWDELNMYLYPRLLWHPQQSSQSLIADYCERAYGEAAKPMLRHWLILEEARERYPRYKEECLALLEQAASMTSDSEALRRIRAVREIWSHPQ